MKAVLPARETLSPASLRGKALALLARREHSRQELTEKLTTAGGDAESIATLLDEFAAQGWQDDLRFALAFARYQARKGHGPLQLRQELQQRGIHGEALTAALAEADWFELARSTRQRKFGDDLPTERKEQARQLRFLQYRGFSMEQCRYALRDD